ncbi:hypothetical protein ACGFMM_31330 [Streptomyces sp. NPDC048604]|uniref:hypothetical protein n=1 Tax=Streptomyces sp. NPDC048604 TaxID=3365578 RepID=UPI0037198AEF
MMRWVLEEFGRESGEFRSRQELPGLGDDEACALLELENPEQLGDGDLFDVPDAAVETLAHRFGLKTDPAGATYLLGREAG